MPNSLAKLQVGWPNEVGTISTLLNERATSGAPLLAQGVSTGLAHKEPFGSQSFEELTCAPEAEASSEFRGGYEVNLLCHLCWWGLLRRFLSRGDGSQVRRPFDPQWRRRLRAGG